jgi:hypothetical protein
MTGRHRNQMTFSPENCMPQWNLGEVCRMS